MVVPVYNVEKYLDRCVNSIINQTYPNLEIILVDDGSPDRCPQICDAWAEKDTRIKVIHKKNAGLGMARNTGIENATGEYICFFDSDDYIAPKILEEAYSLAESSKAEIVFFGMASANNDGQVLTERIPQSNQMIYTGEDVRQVFLPDMISDRTENAQIRGLSLSVCACLFRMELIQRTNWRLVSEREIISEDSYSLLVLFRDVQKAAILPKTGYYYCYNPVSQTQTYRPDRYEKICHFYREAILVQQACGYNDIVKDRIGKVYISFVVAALKQMSVAPQPLRIRIEQVKHVVKDTMLQQVLHNMHIGDYPWKLRIFCRLMVARRSVLVYILARMQARMQQKV